MEAVKTINFIISIVFIVCYTYQFVYILVPFVVKDKRKGEAVSHRYAVLVSARNEEAVIGNLIESIKRQTYDGGLVTTFVVADNCTDDTARVAADAGAIVFERFDTANVGKGYALNYLLHRIDELFPERPFDGYFVFDADNVLEENYIEEMNKVFSQGYGIVTSYRNSKNFGDNWISSRLRAVVPARVAVPQPRPLQPRHQLRCLRHGLPVLAEGARRLRRLALPPAHRGHRVHRAQRRPRPQDRLLS